MDVMDLSRPACHPSDMIKGSRGFLFGRCDRHVPLMGFVGTV